MRSIGVDLAHWMEQGLLHVHASRPSLFGLEMHLATMHREIEDRSAGPRRRGPGHEPGLHREQRPRSAPCSRASSTTSKSRTVTGFFTSLTGGDSALEQTAVGISSVMDLPGSSSRPSGGNGERNRGLYGLKVAGTTGALQPGARVRDQRPGIELLDVYTGVAGVLTGTARLAQQATERAEALAREQEVERRRREIERRRAVLEAQIAAMRAELEVQDVESLRLCSTRGEARSAEVVRDRADMGPAPGARTRTAETSTGGAS